MFLGVVATLEMIEEEPLARIAATAVVAGLVRRMVGILLCGIQELSIYWIVRSNLSHCLHPKNILKVLMPYSLKPQVYLYLVQWLE
jgi:hypothetical protein